MTKSTLSTLWLAGGGLVATWLAVSPNAPSSATSGLSDEPRAGAVRQVTLDDLQLQETTLKDHAARMSLRQSTRNPFRFGKTAAPVTPHPSTAPQSVAPSIPAPPPGPSLKLSGIASEGAKRTAIISSSDGQLYLVKEGEAVAGRYHVVTVDGDAVTLRDDSGADVRLLLH